MNRQKIRTCSGRAVAPIQIVDSVAHTEAAPLRRHSLRSGAAPVETRSDDGPVFIMKSHVDRSWVGRCILDRTEFTVDDAASQFVFCRFLRVAKRRQRPLQAQGPCSVRVANEEGDPGVRAEGVAVHCST